MKARYMDAEQTSKEIWPTSLQRMCEKLQAIACDLFDSIQPRKSSHFKSGLKVS
jgi:hypothetical protein